eukprot:1160244-Pelagomonas_calceolata.AAC.6
MAMVQKTVIQIFRQRSRTWWLWTSGFDDEADNPVFAFGFDDMKRIMPRNMVSMCFHKAAQILPTCLGHVSPDVPHVMMHVPNGGAQGAMSSAAQRPRFLVCMHGDVQTQRHWE